MTTRFLVMIQLLMLSLAVSAGQHLAGRVVPAGEIGTLRHDVQPVYHVPRAVVKPIIDGNGNEWTTVPAMTLDKKEQARGWKDAADLSGGMRLQWDDDGLYFFLTVTDDRHHAPNSDVKLWENDACQFAFDAYLNGPKTGYDADELSFVTADTPKGPRLAAYRLPGICYEQEHLLPEIGVKMTEGPAGVRTYEWMMPWSRLAPVSPWLLGRCGFSFTLNDNDGDGFKGAMFWSKGIIYGQDANGFGELIFDGAAGQQHPTLLGLYPEEKLTGDETDSHYLNIAGAAPWRTARLLADLPQGGPLTAKIGIFRTGEKQPVATGEITTTILANAPMVLAWDLHSLPTGIYEIEYRVPAMHYARRLPFTRVDAPALRARKDALRKEFGIDRPWDPMTDAPPLIRKHRGMVGVLLQLLDEDAWASAMRNVDKHEEHLKSLAQVGRMVEALDKQRDFLAAQRGTFWGAYYSPADGSGQSFVISLPPDYSPHKRYPLAVYLHGSSDIPTPQVLLGPPCPDGAILVEPWGRGAHSGYGGLGEDDVLQVIDYMTAWYPIDPDRVYLSGGSMGGGGTWQIASRFPDRFAAAMPFCGYADGALLDNLTNLPVYAHHGAKDWGVAVDNDRTAIRYLKNLGAPALLREVRDAGHGEIEEYAPPAAWLLSQKRVEKPAQVRFTGAQPDRSYWLTICKLTDPHVPARVAASVVGRDAQQMVTITATGTDALAFDFTQMPINRKCALQVQVESALLQCAAPLPDRIYLLRQSDGWTLADRMPPPALLTRPYHAGGAQLLYKGEPLCIVYGTQGSEARTKALREIARVLERFAGAGDTMPNGRFPIKADREVTPEDMRHMNLIVLGGPQDNALTATLLPRLPITITDNALKAGDRAPVPLDKGWFTLAYVNQLVPQRLLFLAAFDAQMTMDGILEYPPQILTGIWASCPGDVSDLHVMTPTTDMALQFTHGWKWQTLPGVDGRMPVSYFNPVMRMKATLAVLRQATGAAYALGIAYTPKPDEVPTTVPALTLADLRVERSPFRTIIAQVTGEELHAMPLTKSGEEAWLIEPPLDKEQIDKDTMYTVVLPYGNIWSVAILNQKNLHDARFGPEIPREALLRAYAEMP